MTSPSFSFKGTLPSTFKSFMISVGAIVVSISGLLIMRQLFPDADFSTVNVVITTGVSGFLVHLMQSYVLSQK